MNFVMSSNPLHQENSSKKLLNRRWENNIWGKKTNIKIDKAHTAESLKHQEPNLYPQALANY